MAKDRVNDYLSTAHRVTPEFSNVFQKYMEVKGQIQDCRLGEVFGLTFEQYQCLHNKRLVFSESPGSSTWRPGDILCDKE
jgi:hypothetical protein